MNDEEDSLNAAKGIIRACAISFVIWLLWFWLLASW
jgi:hypothetical protein